MIKDFGFGLTGFRHNTGIYYSGDECPAAASANLDKTLLALAQPERGQNWLVCDINGYSLATSLADLGCEVTSVVNDPSDFGDWTGITFATYENGDLPKSLEGQLFDGFICCDVYFEGLNKEILRNCLKKGARIVVSDLRARSEFYSEQNNSLKGTKQIHSLKSLEEDISGAFRLRSRYVSSASVAQFYESLGSFLQGTLEELDSEEKAEAKREINYYKQLFKAARRDLICRCAFVAV